MKKIVELSDRKKMNDEAASWILKLESDDGLSCEHKAELCDWLSQSNLHRACFERLAKAWIGADVLTELAVPLPKARRQSHIMSATAIKCAAALTLTLGVVAFALFNTGAEVQDNRVYETQVGNQKTIDLADGSVLKLNTNSKVRIEYSDEFREIYLLAGEAFFNVAKNKDRPFRVYAGTGRVHAIGTAFSVYLKGDKVDVAVSEGRVGVAAISSANASLQSGSALSAAAQPVKSLGMLRAGEVGIITSQLDSNATPVQTLEKPDELTDVDVANRISWTTGVLIFSGEPLEEVVKEIGRYTDVNIEFSEPGLKQIRIGGNFPVGETDTMFSSLETNFGLQVTRLSPDHIVISDVKKYK